MWGRPLNWSTARIWALAAGGADEPGVIWCGTLPGGLFRSNDHGQSWEMVRALWDHPKRKQWMGGGADLPGIHSICVDPRNSKRVWVAVSTGGIWFTEDAGASWAQRGEGMRAEYAPPEQTHDPIAQDVHCLVQCPAAPDRMWVQHHNGIFVSSDEGKTFTEITGVEPSTFGFAVVVHPREPDTAWFVPEIKDEKRIPREGKLVVTRTRDGGKSFEVLSKGLPQTHAYDVVYRHALALDEAGERLAFGSTTGGLWVSEDQGDSWACVTHTFRRSMRCGSHEKHWVRSNIRKRDPDKSTLRTYPQRRIQPEQKNRPLVCSNGRRRFAMPYTRPVRRFYLTPPSIFTFGVSVVLALIAVFATYGHLVLFKGINAFLILLVAYLVLLAGTLFRGI